MKKMKNVFSTLAAILIFSGMALAQDNNDASTDNHNVAIKINPVAILDIETEGSDVEFIPTAPTEAGLGFDFSATNNSLWLNFTSTVSKNDKAREIQVSYSGTLPAGVTLKVATTTNATGNGKGNRGSSTYVGTPLTLTDKDQDFITGIKTAFTGDGINNGYQLTYSMGMEENDYETLLSGDYNVVVTYTITGE